MANTLLYLVCTLPWLLSKIDDVTFPIDETIGAVYELSYFIVNMFVKTVCLDFCYIPRGNTNGAKRDGLRYNCSHICNYANTHHKLKHCIIIHM